MPYMFTFIVLLFVSIGIGCSVDRDLKASVTATNGLNGIDGINGVSSICTVESLENGSLYTCSDGSSVSITNGMNGTDGTNGVDGINGTNGNNGTDGSIVIITEYTGTTSCVLIPDTSYYLKKKNGEDVKLYPTSSCSNSDSISLGDGDSSEVLWIGTGMLAVSSDNNKIRVINFN